MQLTTVSLSTLLPPKDNPRRTLDTAQVAALAQSIKTDGVLQNLLVRPAEEGKFRVVFGKRRYLALQLLRKQKHIDGDYQVPVDIKNDLTEGDAMRLATVENVLREPMHPMDEAEAFAKLLQLGGAVETIVEKTGLSAQTVKRRLALASLCAGAKKAFRDGTITRSFAEVLTLGSHEQQCAILQGIDDDMSPDVDEVREMLTERRPVLAMAIFPRENYTGTLTTDLFADEETTYFDDLDQFLALQKEAVEALAGEHRKVAAWVDVLFLYSVPWWQYHDAEADEPSGVVINLYPSGVVGVREGLVRHEVVETVVEDTRSTPIVPDGPRERPKFTSGFLRYLAFQKSAAVQAALLQNPRKAKEVATLLLFLGCGANFGLSLSIHPCHRAPESERMPQRSHQELEALAGDFARRFGLEEGTDGPAVNGGVAALTSGDGPDDLYETIGTLSDEELDRLMVFLPILCFGQADHERLDQDDSLFNSVARSIGVNMRDWWTPDPAFLSAIRKEQVLAVATESGALAQLSGLAQQSKKDAVERLSRYFAGAAVSEPPISEANRRAREWLPGIFRFPALKNLSAETKET